MRRDHFELAAENVDWVDAGDRPAEPRVVIDFDGPRETLTERLTDAEGNLLEAGETDVTFRLQDSLDDPDATGVVSVTDRVTGDFLLELNARADDVLRFVRAAREYGQSTDDGGRYRVTLRIDGEPVATYSKSTFLVYDANGSLLRSKSLIPSGVEL
jgi:myo-inositol-hexaphosphate 3-phosphohydrolase